MVVPFAPMASFMAFTIIWMLASLLPHTTKASPFDAFNAAAAASMPFCSLASVRAGAVTAPPNLASNAKATLPVSEGLCI